MYLLRTFLCMGVCIFSNIETWCKDISTCIASFWYNIVLTKDLAFCDSYINLFDLLLVELHSAELIFRICIEKGL